MDINVDANCSRPQHFLTVLLFGSARLPFSEPQKKAVLSYAKALGAKNIPSLDAFKKSQERISQLVGVPTKKVTAKSGNVFYINDVGKAIAKDYANPLTRFAMQDYPEDEGVGMSQVFGGGKMLSELPSPPAARVGGTVFFVDELLQESSGEYFIPERFFLASYSSADACAEEGHDKPCPSKELYALGREVERTEVGFIVHDDRVIVPTSSFFRSFEDISSSEGELECGLTESSMKYAELKPHPLRQKAEGRMVYSVPLIIFMDDVSGNISKQWNKHHTIYMSNANLPREMIEKEFCVRFVTASPHAAPMELMTAMKDSISHAAESGVFTWDCKEGEEVMLVPYALFVAGNNPMQAEECSHAGLNCNYFCRTCDVGGTKEHKQSRAGYDSIFTPGNIRSPQETIAVIKQQIETARVLGAADKIKVSVLSTGVRDTTSSAIVNTLVELGKRLRKRVVGTTAVPESNTKAKLEKEFEDFMNGDSLEGVINPLLGMEGLNIHLDTPTEILHTVLLGVVKYFWGQTVFLLEKSKLLDVFQKRLESVDKDGLNAPCLNADYICHYKGGLIGKHFKSLAQVMPFLTYDPAPKTVLNGWSTIGDLVVLIWHTKIENTKEYLAQLSRAIDDFLNITAQCAPSILISKPKFHFLVHLPLYIRCFGPAIIFSTERYESFNHVFRLACIYSNRQAPSRDTCTIFARQDLVKHIATGGYWLDSTSRTKWVQGGSAVVTYLDENPAQARLLGLPSSKSLPAAGEWSSDAVCYPVAWTNTRCAAILKSQRPSAIYYQGRSLVLGEREHSPLNGHVIFRDQSSQTRIGRIREILLSAEDWVEHVALQVFVFGPTLHDLLRLPQLELTDEEVVISGENILCAVNVQHNCLNSRCVNTLDKQLRQERITTSRTTPTVKHHPTPHYFLNVHSIHNYAHILSVIPENLREAPQRVANVDQVRKTAVHQLQQKKAAKGQEPTVPGSPSIPEPTVPSALPPAAFDREGNKPKPKARAKRQVASQSQTPAPLSSARPVGPSHPLHPPQMAGPSRQAMYTAHQAPTTYFPPALHDHQPQPAPALHLPPAFHVHQPQPAPVHAHFPPAGHWHPIATPHHPPAHLPPMPPRAPQPFYSFHTQFNHPLAFHHPGHPTAPGPSHHQTQHFPHAYQPGPM
ncbi:hypothetical protein BV22DRAFT_1024813 [Leucogyrophana mollusca]|uniref:Uncharacterized protein n=1 Tax=Leucogyrophana mollusca TaxID=85980 RepID=A0ACB8AZJ2_9AGAM|nr:hypothetical protein BV22DRAFT_1024813 [Leucogyrophana mollusca]